MDVTKLTNAAASLASEMDELECYAQGNPGFDRMCEVQFSAERLAATARKLTKLAAAMAAQAKAESERLWQQENVQEAA